MDLNNLILIVEDDLSLQKVLQEKLSQNGFKISLASDGEEGLKKALKEHPSLIILDLLMPRKSGWSMFDDLRKNKWGAYVPVIILTNYSIDDKGIKEVMQNQPSYYFVKTNIKLDDLIEKVKELTIPRESISH